MIDHINIRNFQSLQDVSLDLKPLTVIVGPSSSGKSAFIRALRALAANRRGTDFITHGERISSISAHLTSSDPLRTGTVTLTRSTQTSPNSYTVIPDDPNHPLHPKAEFTKLGGDVPAPVSEFLGIPTEQIALSIAGQFDKPYLLDASGTEVARTLGALTNAHIILSAARESNRQKLSTSQTLRTRADDLDAIKQRIPEFQALKAQREALQRAEDAIAAARALKDRIDRLTALTETVIIAEQRIPALTQALAAIPSLADIEQYVTRYYEAERKLTKFQFIWETVTLEARKIKSARETLATIPDSENIDAAAERLSNATEALQAYGYAQQAVTRAEEAVAERSVALERRAQEFTDAKAALTEAMQGISAGFAEYFRTQARKLHLLDNAEVEAIEVEEAAALAARYLATLDS